MRLLRVSEKFRIVQFDTAIDLAELFQEYGHVRQLGFISSKPNMQSIRVYEHLDLMQTALIISKEISKQGPMMIVNWKEDQYFNISTQEWVNFM